MQGVGRGGDVQRCVVSVASARKLQAFLKPLRPWGLLSADPEVSGL